MHSFRTSILYMFCADVYIQIYKCMFIPCSAKSRKWMTRKQPKRRLSGTLRRYGQPPFRRATCHETFECVPWRNSALRHVRSSGCEVKSELRTEYFTTTAHRLYYSSDPTTKHDTRDSGAIPDSVCVQGLKLIELARPEVVVQSVRVPRNPGLVKGFGIRACAKSCKKLLQQYSGICGWKFLRHLTQTQGPGASVAVDAFGFGCSQLTARCRRHQKDPSMLRQLVTIPDPHSA